MENKTLVIGIGNISRGDDGLGWSFLEKIQYRFPVETAFRYQLQVEDAELVRHFHRVLFVDATHAQTPGGFSFQPCLPAPNFSWTTHRVDPPSLLWLCDDLYDCKPDAYTLYIEGLRWELGQGLSPAGQTNLEKALAFFEKAFAGESALV